MTKKHWIILLVAAVAVAIGLALYFMLRPTAYYPESIDPRTLHASPANKEKIIGLWHIDDHVYYRFNADGTGHTWDVSDDLTEDEASEFSWEAYEEALMITHKMRLRGVVPRYYELDRINTFRLSFHDAYKAYQLDRIEEQMALENPTEE